DPRLPHSFPTRRSSDLSSKEADMRFFSACCGVLFAATASAQGSFPSKPVTMVVGFEPGGGTDTVARIVAKTMGENLGQQVVVERSEEHTSELQSRFDLV